MKAPVALMTLVLLLALAGCGEGETEEKPKEPETTMTESVQPTESAQPAEVTGAVADLAEREGVDPSEVTVTSREQVTWRDGSLGCAKPGTFYTQAMVPGVRIVLSLAGKDYEYHSGGGRTPFLCDRPTQ